MKAQQAEEQVAYNLEAARGRVRDRAELIRLKGSALDQKRLKALENGGGDGALAALATEQEELAALVRENETERAFIPALERRLEQLRKTAVYEAYSELPAKLDKLADEFNATFELAEEHLFGSGTKNGNGTRDAAKGGLIGVLRRLKELNTRWETVYHEYDVARSAYETGSIFERVEIDQRELVIDDKVLSEAKLRLHGRRPFPNAEALAEKAQKLAEGLLVVRKTEAGFVPTWGAPDYAEGAPGWLLEALAAAGAGEKIAVKVIDPAFPPVHWEPKPRLARHLPRPAGSRELVEWLIAKSPASGRLRNARQEGNERRMAEAELVTEAK